LVQVAAGDLKAGRVLGAADLDRLEPGCSDQTLLTPFPFLAGTGP